MHADLSADGDVSVTENVIVSQWREISAEDKHQMHKQVDEILRPLGLKTTLLVVDRSNSISLSFYCMDMSALESLRDQLHNGELKRIVESLFTLLSGATVQVKTLSLPKDIYERCLEIFNQALIRVRSAPAYPAKDPEQHTKIPPRPETAPIRHSKSQFKAESPHEYDTVVARA